MGVHDGHRKKMRARFLETGLDAFADHEALELLLYYAIPRKDTNGIAHELMNRYGTLEAVLSAPVEDLMRVEGIGEHPLFVRMPCSAKKPGWHSSQRDSSLAIPIRIIRERRSCPMWKVATLYRTIP